MIAIVEPEAKDWGGWWLERPSFANDPIAVAKNGNTIITALIVATFAIIGSGFRQWINTGGK